MAEQLALQDLLEKLKPSSPQGHQEVSQSSIPNEIHMAIKIKGVCVAFSFSVIQDAAVCPSILRGFNYML